MNLDDQFFPGQKLLRRTYGKSEGWLNHEDTSFILHRGIVIDINLNIENGIVGSTMIPPASIQAKVIGDDTSTTTPINDNNRWFTPLLPIHSLSIPEIGEEVWLIKETTTNESQGSWICRVSDSSFISKVLARQYAEGQNTQDRYQMNFRVEDIAIEITDSVNKSFSIPFIPGDVFQQGRSDSYVRHSLDPRNNRSGVLEFGVKEKRRYDSINTPSIGDVHTKTVHVKASDLRRLTALTINDGSLESNRDIIYSKADTFVNESKATDSEPTFNRHVLGEKITEVLLNTVDRVESFAKIMSIIIFVFFTHIHKVAKIDLGEKTISITTTEGSGTAQTTNTQTFNIGFKVPEHFTQGPKTLSSFNAANLEATVKEILEDINNLRDEINRNDHLSKHQYIN